MPLDPLYVSNRAISVGKGFKRNFSGIYTQTLTNPAAAATNGSTYGTLTPLAAAGTKTAYATGQNGDTVFAGTYANGKPDFPRNVVITVTHASSVVALSGVITGIDIYGRILTEAWSVTATGTSKTFTGAKSFYQVQTITVVSAADASADTVAMDIGAVFGLDVNNAIASGLKEVAAGSVVTTGTFLATSAVSTADPRGTYAPSTAPDGTKTYTVWIISDNPENS